MQMIGRHFDRDCCYGQVSARRAELSHVVEFQPIRHFSPVKSAMRWVSNACALVVTAAKFILHCIQVYVFGTVPRFTGAETTSRTSAQIFSGPIRLHGDN